MDTVGSSNNRKGRSSYPVDFKERLAKEACEPGVSVSKLAGNMGSTRICCSNGGATCAK